MQVPGDDDQFKMMRRQDGRSEVRTPSAHFESTIFCAAAGLRDGVKSDVDAKGAEPKRREQERVPTAAHRNIEGAARLADPRR